MITYGLEPFTGSNGSAPANFTDGGGATAGATATIQSNTMELNSGSAVSGFKSMRWTGGIGVDQELYCTVLFPASHDGRLELWLRSGSSTDDGGDGYLLGIKQGSNVQATRATGFTYPTVGAAVSKGITNGVTYGVRFGILGVGGVTVRWKVWALTSPEPNWDVNVTDSTTPYFASSGFQFAHINGGTTTAQKVDIDDWTLYNGADPDTVVYSRPETITLLAPFPWATPIVELPPSYFGGSDILTEIHNVVGPEGDLGLSVDATVTKILTASVTASLGLAGSGSGVKVSTASARSALGLRGSGSGVKVAPVTLRGSLGLSGVSIPKHVGRPAVTGSLGLSGNGIGVHVGRPSITGSLGLSGVSTPKHVGRPAVTGSLGLAGNGVAVHVGRPAVSGVLGLAGTGADTKVLRPVAYGAVGLRASGAGVHVGRPSVAASTGLAGTATAMHVGKPVATGAVGLRATGAGAKVIGLSGSSSVGLVGMPSYGVGRALTLRSSLGLTSVPTVRHVGRPSGSGSLGLAGSGSGAHVGRPSGSGSLGLAGSGSGVKVSRPSATGVTGLAGSGSSTKIGRPSVLGVIGLAGSGSTKRIARPQVSGSLGVSSTGGAKKISIMTARNVIGLSAHGIKIIVRIDFGQAFAGLSAYAIPSFLHPTRSGGWASLQSVLDYARQLLRGSEEPLACPFCGEPMIGNWCPFGAVHLQMNTPPKITEESTVSDPGPWESLVSILRDAGSNAVQEARTPPLACPRCGEPLIQGHCQFDGWQGATLDDE